MTFKPVEIDYDVVKFDIDLSLSESNGEVVGGLIYSTALFDRSTIDRHVGYLQTMLQAMVNSETESISAVDILSSSERELLLQTWNSTNMPYPDRLCIHQLFENQAEQSPEAIAIVHEDQQMSYRELNARANGLAHHLIGLGVKPDSLVVICIDRSLTMIIGLLAVLKAGGAYVPLDPSFASERLHGILNDVAPSILVADDTGIAALGSSISESTVVVNPNVLSKISTTNPHVPKLTPEHLAYVIYTSGSTGKPKGVMLEHQGVANLAALRPKVFGVDSSSRVLQFFSLSFDASVHEIWSALCHGGTLHILPNNVRQDLALLWSYLEQQSITHAALTPTLLQHHEDLLPLHTPLTMVVGGEALSSSLINVMRTLIPNGSIINAYGPTETTVDAIAWKCPGDFNGDIAPIGRPHPNKRIYVLDSHRKLVPMGAVGELYIAGAGVARGYLSRSHLTDKVFFSDPFTPNNKSRMYKTGDLVRYLPDGNLMFLGRDDHQVKIRGYRVELGEIEARLLDHTLVREAAVLALGEGSSKRLVAYVAADPTKELAHTLRSHISAKLPEYMVPAAFIRMDALPFTLNGKLDRRALPEPGSDAFVSQRYEAPQGNIETALADIWADLLKIERVGRHDNFFMLGGHSLLAVQMVERLRRVDLNLSIRALFDAPTLSALSQSLNKHHVETMAPANRITPDIATITPDLLPLIDLTQDDIDTIVKQVNGGITNIQDIYALSPLQDGILFHHIMATKGDPYLLINCMSFDKRDTLDNYLEAFQKVVDRHDILRTAIVWEHLSSPAQVVLRQATLSITEMVLNPADGPVSKQLMKLFDPREHRIELSQAPLTRFVIAQDVDDRWVVVQLMHHLIGDHSTLEQMMIEIKAFLDGRGEALPSPQPFRNLIAQARSGSGIESHEKFFTKMLAEIDTPALPYGVSDVHGDGIDVTEAHYTLPQVLNNRLRDHAKRMGVSLASLCHLAWAQVISRTSGQEQVVFGTVLFGRMQGGSGSDRAMGLFINTLPLRVDVDNRSVLDSVLRTHTDLAALLEHEHASLALAQRCSSIPAGTSLFSAMLNYRHNSTPSSDESQNFTGINTIEAIERTNYPFVMSVEDGGVSLGLTAQIVQPFDPVRICGYMQQALQSLVDALDHSPEIPVRKLEILTGAERELLLQTWNATNVTYPDNLCIHHIFENRVAQSPNAIALSYESESLTYNELN
ncbi:hypothetical protein BGZ79_003946, partial [Entomortierella chlamydospora]